MQERQSKTYQRLTKRFMRLNQGKRMSLDEYQKAFKAFCKSIMKREYK